MTVRLAASLVILVGCAYLGFSIASAFRRRARQLEEFYLVIKQMEFDIDFLNMPLYEAFKRVSGICEGGVKNVIDYVGGSLTENHCVDMHSLWKKAFERFEHNLELNEADKRIMLDFAKNLGCGDRVREKNNINAAAMRLKVAGDEARTTAEVNGKMYRGLGVLGGIFVVIVLL